MKVKSFQALRFLMISSIFFAHISFIMTNERATTFFYRYLNNGVFGVTFFFMLSGFCLNLGYHDRLANLNKDSYLGFVKRRIVKIYPIYIIMQTVYLIMEIVKNPVIENVKELLCKYFISIPLLQMVIPSKKLQISLNAVSWFLSVLFLLYLVAPLVIMLAASIRDSIKKNMAVLVVLVLMYMTFILYSYGFLETDGRYFITRSFIMNMLVFSIGVFLSNIRLGKTVRTDSVKKKVTFSLLEILILGMTVILYFGTVIFPNWKLYYFLKLMIFVFLIFIFSYDGGVCSRIFSLKVFDILGNASFEFYLMHYFIIRLVAVPMQKIFGTGNWDNLLITGILFVGTWLLAVLCNRFPVYLSGRNRNVKA